MPLVRMEFEKTGCLRFISHLDLVRLFQRAMRRAGIPVAYSKGFNPHARISLGPALALGISSTREYMDVELDEDIEPGQMLDRLNKCLPEGVKISKAKLMPEGAAALTAVINASLYSIQAGYKPQGGDIEERIKSFFEADHVYIDKIDKKKRVKKVDIVPMILDVKKAEAKAGNIEMVVMLETGSSRNLKPGDMLKALADFAGVEITGTKIRREGLYILAGGKYRTPFDHNVMMG
jgi:radical SAM-linked protein